MTTNQCLNALLDQADAAFQAGDERRYEDMNEEIRSLVDRHPELATAAEDAGVFGGGR